jgi:hypothetical protein
LYLLFAGWSLCSEEKSRLDVKSVEFLKQEKTDFIKIKKELHFNETPLNL